MEEWACASTPLQPTHYQNLGNSYVPFGLFIPSEPLIRSQSYGMWNTAFDVLEQTIEIVNTINT